MFILLAFLANMNTLCFGILSSKTDIEKHLNTNANKNSLTYAAVFLLSTLQGAPEFGGPKEGRNFFARVQAARATWAWPLKHFYSVVGKQPDNDKIISNPSYCVNHTDMYHKHMSHMRTKPHEEVYECAGIKVLYLPYCDSSSWGPMGPCCRCEGAMRYYMNNYAVHPEYPSW